MKFSCQFVFLLLLINLNAVAQHTFSIAAVDSLTNEIGSAGATCLGSEDGALYVSDIVLNVGSINTQAWWTIVNQNAAGERIEEGLSPQEIIDWLSNNDNSAEGGNISDRQYGIVDLNNGSPRSAAFTGVNNFDVKGQRLGANYSIQGNVLISEDVLDDMESAFLNTDGTLADKLMATLQAAKRPGADVRCLDLGLSSASAYVRVAKPTDTSSDYGNLWLDLNVWLDSGEFTGDPIDELQRKFDAFTQSVSISESLQNEASIYPNPTNGKVTIVVGETPIVRVDVYDLLGNLMDSKTMKDGETEHIINLQDLVNGQYILNVQYAGSNKVSYIMVSKLD